MSTTTTTHDDPVRITGTAAADIATYVRVYLQPTTSWMAITGGPAVCDHGCHLHVRQIGRVPEYRIIHRRSRGCPIAEDQAISWEPVIVEAGTRTPRHRAPMNTVAAALEAEARIFQGATSSRGHHLMVVTA